jgi:peptidyl-prolyl cis-trans isomerase SurA
MRILIVCDFLFKYGAQQARALVQCDHNVAMLCRSHALEFGGADDERAELVENLEREGIQYANYREDIRRQVLIQRVREREVDSKINVSDAEVDNYLATVASQAGEDEYMLSHIYVTVPEQATPDVVQARRQRAEDALAQVKAGKDFAEVAASYSNAPDAGSGGNLGWRSRARLPSVFADVVRTMKPGEVSGILRSAGGFHIVKLAEVRNVNQPTVVEQTHARHILIKVNETTSEAEGLV